MTPIPEDPSVLVVDDERQLADLYAAQLPAEYDVTVRYGGKEALDAVSSVTDVVLLDRRMPDLPGDEVLERLRDRDLDCRVVMVSAVDPDFDISEMPFDDYLAKPVSGDDLVSAVRNQLELRTRDDRLNEYLELRSKIMLLEVEKRRTELADSEEYTALVDRVDELEVELTATIDDFEAVRDRFLKTNRTR
jgi:DNA-binding response OmpR family regulator